MKMIYILLIMLVTACNIVPKKYKYIDTEIMEKVSIVLEVKIIEEVERHGGSVSNKARVLNVIKNENNIALYDTIYIWGMTACIDADMYQKDTSLIVYLVDYKVIPSDITGKANYYCASLYKHRYPHYRACMYDSILIK